MHEFSICTQIVDAAIDEYDRLSPAPQRLSKVRVVVGRMHQIVPEHLIFAYEVLTRGTAAEGSEIELVPVPVAASCPSCGWCGTLELPVFRCGDCGAREIEVQGGKELYLEHIEVEWPGDCT